MHDHLLRAISREHGLRVVCTVTRQVVADAAGRHELSPAATCAVGRALTSGLLLATLTKGGERVTIQLVGDGPIGAINVDATDGVVRGYAREPRIEVVPDAEGRYPVGRALGRNGVVNVLRDLGLRDRYQGQVPLVTGEVDEDLEAYLRSSEQVPSALGCEVLLDETGAVKAAAGLLVQALPDGDPESVRELQHLLRTGRLHEVLAARPACDAQGVLEGFWPPQVLELIGDVREVRFGCRCSRARIGEMLQLLGTVDLDEMIAEDKPAEITCNFCNARYEISRDELERIRAQARPRQSN